MVANHTTRALIVEDDDGLLDLLSAAFQYHNIIPTRAPSTREALTRLKSDPAFCAVVLDLRLPDGNGLFVVDQIRMLDRKPPVLVITGMRRDERPDLDPRLVHLILHKPFDPETLAYFVQRLCDSHRDASGVPD